VIFKETTSNNIFSSTMTWGCGFKTSFSCSLSIRRSKAPWYLEAKTIWVYVVGAKNAIKMELIVASEIFEEFGWFLICGIFDYL
jgi:hypothetical protein